MFIVFLDLMMSPSQDRYRTPTPNSSVGEAKTSSQGSQTPYKHDIQTSTAQPIMQQAHFEKSNSNSQNFLAQGHHPRSLATEGGGTWDFGKLPKLIFTCFYEFVLIN